MNTYLTSVWDLCDESGAFVAHFFHGYIAYDLETNARLRYNRRSASLQVPDSSKKSQYRTIKRFPVSRRYGNAKESELITEANDELAEYMIQVRAAQ